MEKKILYNVLRAIRNGGRGTDQAPDKEYIKGLEAIGAINNDWDVTLTALGHDMLKWLESSFDNWGT